ncbi:MAG: deaminase [Streptosporangiales bacterium]|nr:deaminase [Streptosporangiales bacterium]
MATAVAEMMSLDGFVAGPADEVEHLFGWYGNGDVAVPAPGSPVTFRTSEASAGHLRDLIENIAAVVSGRRMFESAVSQAKAVAGDGIVGVGGASIAQQCLNAGLLDEIRVNLVPVLLGGGIRFFDNLAVAPAPLRGPRVIEGKGVTHLYYRVSSPA